MTCSYCGTRNGDGEHRCRRCGRKPGDTLTTFQVHRTDGALAAKYEPAPRLQVSEPPPARPNFSRAVQGSLFHDRPASNVIPIASYAPPRPRAKAETGAGSTTRPATRRHKPVPEGQGSLDFLPSEPAKPRTLSTTVEAVIYCEAPVATTLHRAVASALDWSMVVIGYGVFLLAFRFLGGEIVLTKANEMVFGGMLLLIGFAYGLCFTMAGAETPGMHWTHLRLTTFDGFPLEPRQRLLRFAAACLSRCTLLGLFWSLADEENLAWQDHISRTFPTPREVDSQVFRRR
jgi:uncharacterized RDD family membrane protein YckC